MLSDQELNHYLELLDKGYEPETVLSVMEADQEAAKYLHYSKLKPERKRTTAEEDLEAFPEAAEFIPGKLTEVFGELTKLKAEGKDHQAKQREYNRLKAYMYLINRHKVKDEVDDFQIQQAKDHPIVDLVEQTDTVRRAGSKYFCRCPFHEEKTASMCLFPENNSYYCFGCGANGDTIEWVMQTRKLSFKEAVMLLQ